MVRTFLALAFIAGVAAIAIYCARKPTVARGAVIAADLLEQNQARGWKELACDDEIPIEISGATFHCALVLRDGDSARLELHLTPEGAFMMKVLDSSHPEHAHVPPKADPWD
jgi:hypothetical protein